MLTLSTNVLIFFSAMAAIVSLFWLYKTYLPTKAWQQVTGKTLAASIKVPLIAAIPFALAFAAAELAGVHTMAAIPFFLGAVFVFYILTELKLPENLRGLLLLALSVFLTSRLPQDTFGVPLLGALAGLTVFKIATNLTDRENSSLADFIPSFVYLTGMYWLHSLSGGSDLANNEGILLSALTAAIFIAWVQGPFMGDDKVYLKRVMLSLTGGLVMLIAITKLVVAVKLTTLAVLAGAGFFVTYLLQAMDEEKEETPRLVNALKQLIVIGIFTLLASRLFGTVGVLVMAATTLVAIRGGVAQIAALFWITKTFAHAFTEQFNPNVTGINLTHPYSAAGLYAGFLIVVFASVLFRDLKGKPAYAGLFLLVGATLPLCSNFFVHEEPTGALLVSAYVAAVLMSTLAPAIYNKTVPGHENLMLLPVVMTASAIMSNELIPLGNEASAAVRQNVVIAILVVAFVVWLVLRFVKPTPKPVEAAEG